MPCRGRSLSTIERKPIGNIEASGLPVWLYRYVDLSVFRRALPSYICPTDIFFCSPHVIGDKLETQTPDSLPAFPATQGTQRGSEPGGISLDDKYLLKKGRIFTTGTQALVRLPMTQHHRDQQNGLNTAGYVSGYRGSPLGTFDDQLAKAGKHLSTHNVLFVPGVNEDLAATAVWGTQHAEATGEGRYDGVFAMWYGKGPGVDRTGDAFRHGNLAGSSRHGGVLLMMNTSSVQRTSRCSNHS